MGFSCFWVLICENGRSGSSFIDLLKMGFSWFWIPRCSFSRMLMLVFLYQCFFFFLNGCFYINLPRWGFLALGCSWCFSGNCSERVLVCVCVCVFFRPVLVLFTWVGGMWLSYSLVFFLFSFCCDIGLKSQLEFLQQGLPGNFSISHGMLIILMNLVWWDLDCFISYLIHLKKNKGNTFYLVENLQLGFLVVLLVSFHLITSFVGAVAIIYGL